MESDGITQLIFIGSKNELTIPENSFYLFSHNDVEDTPYCFEC